MVLKPFNLNVGARSRLIYLLILCIVALITSPVNAQQYQFKTYSYNNGLSSYNAGKVIQDKYGFIWVTTQEGLNRFDGRGFLTVKKDPASQQGLAENYVTDVVEDNNGRLWVSTALGGVDVLNPENLLVEKRLHAGSAQHQGLITNWIRCLSWAGNQELWIGTYYGLNVYNDRDNKYTIIRDNPVNAGNPFNICYIGKDSTGHMWIAVENDGVAVYNIQEKRLVTVIRKTALGFSADEYFAVRGIYSENGNVYLCTNKGIKKTECVNGYYLMASVTGGLFALYASVDVRSVVRDADGNTWIGTSDGIVVHERVTGKASRLQHSSFLYNTLLDNDVNHLYTDRQGNVWVATAKGLNQHIKDQFQFRTFSSRVGDLSRINHTYTLYPDQDSIIYACTSVGLIRVNVSGNTMATILPGNKYGDIETVIRIAENGLLVSAYSRLLYLEQAGTSFRVISVNQKFKELAQLRVHYFSSFFRYNDSLIFMGSMEDEGLIKWNIKTHRLVQYKKNSMPGKSVYEDNIHSITPDNKGNIWITGNESITMFDPQTDRFKYFFPGRDSAIKSNPHFFFDVYDDGSHLWITSYGGGLLQLDPASGKFRAFTEKDGLSANTCYSILPEGDSAIWISTNRGLSRFNLASHSISKYFFADGLHSDAFDERSACKLGEALYFGGVDGFSEITINKTFQGIRQLPVYIGKIIYTGDEGEEIQLNALNIRQQHPVFNDHPVTFYIISPNYQNQDRSRFAYRIDELSNEWIDIGNRNNITLTGLRPGTYHLRGKIINQAGYAAETVPLVFSIRPEWYQTWMFKTALVLCLAALLWLFYRYRISQLNKQQQIRKAIASDLHDDIGSTLNSVKIFTHLAETAPDNRQYLQQIGDALKQASAGLRDMIWVLDDTHDTVEELVERLNQFAKPVTEASGILLRFDIDKSAAKTALGKTEKRNLLLIAKEAINNSIKYAACKNILVSFSRQQGKLTMTIRDDGNGFELNAITPGNGLRNMQERAQQIHYMLAIDAIEGNGTLITVAAK